MKNCFNFKNPGYLLVKLTDEELAPIWAEVNRIQNNFDQYKTMDRYLAGNIRKEYQLLDCRDHVQTMMQPYLGEYIETFGFASRLQQLTSNVPLVLGQRDLWVNFQERLEFNPPHDHSGVFSFVIWLQIPYTLEEEFTQGPGATSNEPINGEFSFIYQDVTGRTQVQRMGADRSKEGYLCLFPHTLFHSVAPFYTTDQLRISVSGNFKFLVR